MVAYISTFTRSGVSLEVFCEFSMRCWTDIEPNAETAGEKKIAVATCAYGEEVDKNWAELGNFSMRL